MRILTLIFCLSSFLVFSQGEVHPKKNKKAKPSKEAKVIDKGGKFKIEILLTQTSLYCGGAKPPDELLKKLNTPKPLIEKTVYIKKGDNNTFDSEVYLKVSSDTSGKIRFQLPAGKYFIVDESKKDSSCYYTLLKEYGTATKNTPAVDKKCLKNWYEQPNFVFEIKDSDVKDLIINFPSSPIILFNTLPPFAFIVSFLKKGKNV